MYIYIFEYEFYKIIIYLIKFFDYLYIIYIWFVHELYKIYIQPYKISLYYTSSTYVIIIPMVNIDYIQCGQISKHHGIKN